LFQYEKNKKEKLIYYDPAFEFDANMFVDFNNLDHFLDPNDDIWFDTKIIIIAPKLEKIEELTNKKSKASL